MLSPGAKIDDRYEIIDALGSGGMGHVYRARRIRETRAVDEIRDEIHTAIVFAEIADLMGGVPNPRGDVFTIGVLAYQLVTGVMPFKAASLPELIGQMLQTKPAPPESPLPDAVRDAILTALDSVPANRFDSADAFARALA